MSTISSGIGLISGLNIQSIVDALIKAQSGPIDLLKARVANITQERTALLSISAQLLAIRSSAASFKSVSAFNATAASSSNSSVLVATASSGAAQGQYSFVVRSLATAHQLISSGFATSDSTPIGAGTITIESGAALVNRSTTLRSLNGGAGVPAGRIRITDRSGGAAEIDLSGATTVDDALRAINSQTGANVTASVAGDHLVLTDRSGGTGSLTVAEVGAGRTAAGLGLLGTSATGPITGQNLVRLTSSTALSQLNDGNGVRHSSTANDLVVHLADGTTVNVKLGEQLTDATPLAILNGGNGVPAGAIRITNRSGASANINVAAGSTIGDFKSAVAAAGLHVSVTTVGGQLVLTDSSGGTGTLLVDEVSGGTVASALGLNKPAVNNVLTGDSVYRVQTLGDVLRVVNSNAAAQGKLTASIASDGTHIELHDQTQGADAFSVDSTASANDLGIAGSPGTSTITSRRLIAGLNTVLLRSLNGGHGVQTGIISLTDRQGHAATVDLTAAQSLSDVVDAINSSGVGIQASVASNGLGLQLVDNCGGTGNLIVSDASGNAAHDLRLTTDAATSRVQSGNLQRQYISETTRLSTFRDGAGVPAGKFRITDSTGASAVVDLTQGNEQTLQDVIDEINSRPVGVHATINANGDGLLLTDTAGGAGQLHVAEEGGTTAKALGILGSAVTGQTTIDGSLETKIIVTAGDTLQSVLTKIRATKAAVSASIVNDSSSSNAYRLSIVSTTTGRNGELAIDGGNSGLSFDTLVNAHDAAVIFGSADGPSPLVLTSSTNTIHDAVDGLDLTLVGTSSQPVTVNLSRDVSTLVKSIQTFVTAYNSARGTMSDATSYDSTTQRSGILLGDDTGNRINDRLTDIAGLSLSGLSPPFNRPAAVGLTVSSGGALVFNEDKFRTAYESDPAAVTAFFTDPDKGFEKAIEKDIDALTATDTGAISRKDAALQSTQDLLNKRASDLQTLLDKQRARLTAQFNFTETALAQLQQQQAALSSLGALSSSSGSSVLPGL